MKVSFDKVLGQELAKKLLSNSITSGRIAPVYLFSGPEGVGKATLSIEFVKALFCEGKEERPCDSCNFCHRVERFVHPDLWILLPSKITGDEKELKKYWELREKMGEDGWIRPKEFDRTKSISYHMVKMIQGELGKHPYEARYRFVLVLDADLLTQVAQNNLLKVLEENPTETHFILVTSRPQMVLTTLRSRSQIVPFMSLSFEDFSRYAFDGDNIEVLYRLSNGSIGEARRLVGSPWIERRGELVEFIKEGDKGGFSSLFLSIRGERSEIIAFLKIFGMIMRDIFLLKMGLESFITNLDLVHSLKEAAERVSFSRLEKLTLNLSKGEEGLMRQVNPDLLLSALLSPLVRDLGEAPELKP